MIAGSLGQLIDYMIIGMACWKVGGVFSKNALLTAHLGDRIAARTVTGLGETPEKRHGHPLVRYRVAIAAGGATQETFYDFYPRPRSTARTGAPRILMIWHHGQGELPHDYTFHNLFFGPDPIVGADLVTVKATYHPPHLLPSRDLYLSDAACWVDMMADSVALAGHIAERHRADYDGVFLGGVSLGGIVTMAALAYHDHFDLYHPMMVGPNVPEQLGSSLFLRFTSADVVRSLKQDLDMRALNFVPVVERNLDRVQFIAGEHDLVFRVDSLRALARRLPGLDLTVLPYAHITGCMAGVGIRALLFDRWRRWQTGRLPPAGIVSVPAGAGIELHRPRVASTMDSAGLFSLPGSEPQA